VDDSELLAGVVAGDVQCFRALVMRYHAVFVRVARLYVRTEASAEDVAQDTWMAIMRGATSFEGRSSVKTWMFRILVNRARKLGTREDRVVATDLMDPVPASRFDQSGMWSVPPTPFADAVDQRLDDKVLIEHAREALAKLDDSQRAVVTLRDIEGLSTVEVAELLDLTEANVRVIAHRGRAKIRERLEVTMKEARS
jgi:RNA polymerase sigma-70 factor (ECF subfamily)